jgi:DNA polymerase III psi subunit
MKIKNVENGQSFRSLAGERTRSMPEHKIREREIEELDPALSQALHDFKASVHAWSDDAYYRARSLRTAVSRGSWRLAVSLSLASALCAAVISGSLYQQRREEAQARVAMAEQVERDRQLAQERAEQQEQQAEKILASVDTAVSREVPTAMEPLAAMGDAMNEGME